MSAKGQAMPAGDEQPIIVIKKIKKVVGGHHGGAWKVAFADFMTALMALFLLLWLVGSSSEEEKKAIAGYFRDEPIAIPGQNSPGVGILEGGKGLMPSESAADSMRLAETQLAIQHKLDKNGALAGLQDQVKLTMTEEGLQIEIIDKANNVLFDAGSSALKPEAARILAEITQAVAGLDNRIVIGGHTDSVPYGSGSGRGRSNWELSTERANAARASMVTAGLEEGQLATVAGYADTRPRVLDNPADPTNRRISLTVLRKATDPGHASTHPEAPPEPAAEPAAPPTPPPAASAATPRPIGNPIDPHLPPGSLGLGDRAPQGSGAAGKSVPGEKKKGADAGRHAVKPEQGQAAGNHHP